MEDQEANKIFSIQIISVNHMGMTPLEGGITFSKCTNGMVCEAWLCIATADAYLILVFFM